MRAYASSGIYDSQIHNPNQSHLDQMRIDSQATKAQSILALYRI